MPGWPVDWLRLESMLHNIIKRTIAPDCARILPGRNIAVIIYANSQLMMPFECWRGKGDRTMSSLRSAPTDMNQETNLINVHITCSCFPRHLARRLINLELFIIGQRLRGPQQPTRCIINEKQISDRRSSHK